MSNNFQIYLLGLNFNQTHPLINGLEDDFTIIRTDSIEEDLIAEEAPLLIIFDYKLKLSLHNLLNKALEESIPTIAMIQSLNDQEATKLTLLEEGFEDVLSLEMSDEEKLARVKRSVKRYLKTSRKVIQYRDLSLDKKFETAIYKQRSLNLSRIEFNILYTLFDHAKVLVSREKLIRSIWKSTKSNNLNTHLANIRIKLEGTPIKIITQRGQGIKAVLEPDN
ncbi:winged helix-turn-helix domain-containing protein [Halobacteriovorax sp. JY17]|uniref:response regulator transcription factor n=1 Tax=Halobacteriovorax sp. JY17 TaxID=2014617 RepID=UPI000C4BF437|nr:winged helix-turn-helix domain-containing protein [Halobacteriovorax sp. JY17]PIK16524.1 MAG: hypothetical protein CES88_07225 [Halobacteriovorax sp. JY17]